jgi:hypothetical protein
MDSASHKDGLAVIHSEPQLARWRILMGGDEGVQLRYDCLGGTGPCRPEALDSRLDLHAFVPEA